MKTGLIMEGGAMRCLFTCGVIDVFMENNIEFDGAAGISAGASLGCNIKSRQVGRPLRYNKKYSKNPNYYGLGSLIRTGDLFNVEFCYHTIPEKLDPFDAETFRDNPLVFYVGATDVKTGKIVFHKCSDGGPVDIEWLRASSSMPIVSKPVNIGKYTLLDGGITDPVPYHFMEKKGYDRNVIVLTQPKGYRKTPTGWAMLKLLRRYPAIARAMEVRHIRYNRQMDEIDERERLGKSFVIRPPESLGIGHTEKDPEEFERVYQLGRNTAKSKLEQIRAFLGAD